MSHSVLNGVDYEHHRRERGTEGASERVPTGRSGDIEHRVGCIGGQPGEFGGSGTIGA